jgi:hypothetical protein
MSNDDKEKMIDDMMAMIRKPLDVDIRNRFFYDPQLKQIELAIREGMELAIEDVKLAPTSDPDPVAIERIAKVLALVRQEEEAWGIAKPPSN